MSIKQAIEALECMVDEKADYMIRNKLGNPFVEHSTKQAIAALAALRSMPQGEPVGEKQTILDGLYAAWNREPAGDTLAAIVNAIQHLQATPHTEAVRMSEAEIDELWKAPMSADWEHREFARAVEQATAARLGVKLGDV